VPERPPGSRRVSKLRTTQIDDELWAEASAIAKIRGDKLAAVMRDAVKRYVARNRHLLTEKHDESE
jgi:hypothetical protein